MYNNIYINRVSGMCKRKVYDDEDEPSFEPGFDTWLDMKALNFKEDYPWVSFSKDNDFIGVPRPYNIISENKTIPGYFIIFKDSAISRSSENFKHYMKIRTRNLINKIPGGLEIFFPRSAYYYRPTKIYIDGPRPICNDNNFPPIENCDTWINMKVLNYRENHPWVAFNRLNDLIDAPPSDIDTNKFSGYAIKFKPYAISDSNEGMNDPEEVIVNNGNVTKNHDGTITIIIPKEHYTCIKSPRENNYHPNFYIWD